MMKSEQMSLSDLYPDLRSGASINANADSGTLTVVRATFIDSFQTNADDLFDGFDELYAITYSYGVDFVNRICSKFKKAEIVFGFEDVVGADEKTILALSGQSVRFIAERKAVRELWNKIESGSLKYYVSNNIKSHEKIYILKADDGRRRVITGSGNFSLSAFGGLQRENIIVMDGDAAYSFYMERYNDYRLSCSDKIEPKQINAFVKDPKHEAEADDLPILNPAKKGIPVVINQQEEAEDIVYIRDAELYAEEYKDALPKPKGKGLKIQPKKMVDIRLALRKIQKQKEKERKEREVLPNLHINYETDTVTFAGKQLDLNPSSEQIRSDIKCLEEYMAGFDQFSGDVPGTKRDYWYFLVWSFVSPFFAYLRYLTLKYIGHNAPVAAYPVFAILYGNSHGGKSAYVSFVSKLMSGQEIPSYGSDDFTPVKVKTAMANCEGLPITYDDVSGTRLGPARLDEIIKVDNFGYREKNTHFAPVVITTNSMKSIANQFSKRTLMCHINACIDKDDAIKTTHIVNDATRNASNALYLEFLRRMLPVINDIAESIIDGDTSHQDVFAKASDVIVSIIEENAEIVPEYAVRCSYIDLMGDRAAAQNAITKIQNAWEANPDAFSISEKTNRLSYKIENGLWELSYIKNELPPSLQADVSGGSCLVMDLHKAREFFKMDFRKKRKIGLAFRKK